VVAAVARERGVEEIAEEHGAVDWSHRLTQTGRRLAADVAEHGVQRVRHRIDGVHYKAELRVLHVIRSQRLVSCNSDRSRSRAYVTRCWLAVWLSGNALASINVVALRQTRLVPGWVTVYGRVNHLGI